MPSPQKIVDTHSFTDGINTVLAKELMPNTAARFILNCDVLSQGDGNVGIVTNQKGNLQIQFALPAGENKCIGTAVSEENNKFYFFVWNSNRFHSIYEFNGVTKGVVKVLQNLADTGNVDIMNLNKDYLILHAEIVRDNLLYWVDGYNNARKTNINKLFDKSDTGYGTIILQSFIDAYKQIAPYAPTAVYFSDTTKLFNRLYGALRKFAIRYVYDDGEKSNVSDFSAVPLPIYEPFTGINAIPSDNNGINVQFATGDRTVKLIEIFMQSTSLADNISTLLDWVTIATLDKHKIGIPDDSTYTYAFYNDGTYSVADQEKIIRPYSYMPKRPLCQSFVRNALVYTNGYEGFESVDIDMSSSVTYEDLFIDSGVENEFNEPQFIVASTSPDFVYETESVTYYDGVVSIIPIGLGGIRFNRIQLTIGVDVKEGNIFTIKIDNGYAPDVRTYSVTATNTDTALTIANKLKQQLITSGRIYRKTEELPDSNIYDNTIVSGNVTFAFIFRPTRTKGYPQPYTSVNPVQFDTLKDTGQSVRNIKLGSQIKLGIMYEDFDGRKSLVYTQANLITSIKTINELINEDGKTGYQAPSILVQINHLPPKWAKYYQIVRSNDLIYGNYIQMLIQKVITLNNEDEQDYLDLAVGSLFTYQKIHPNTTLSYEFKKGDRLRLLKKTSDDTYYDFFETEIMSYRSEVSEDIQSNLVTDGTATVTVAASLAGNIGKVLIVDGFQRDIVDAPTPTTYLLNNIIGDTTEKTYLNYTIVDRRGVVRIRKPSSVTIEDNSVVEIYSPSNYTMPEETARFYEFQKKFAIINPGSDNAYHDGNPQFQDATQPALVKISEGTAYVRNREMPTNNVFPGTQLEIETIEDPSYSDFYASLMNDNGRINVEDTDDGEVHFGSRMRYSNNFIEDTRINGLNDFDNTDREDYNDQYGDFKLTKFNKNLILALKELRATFVPVDERITQSNNGIAMNVNSTKLLNPIQYYAWEGGVGNNPESYAENGTDQYWISVNSGVVIRLAFNGEQPISKTYALDDEIRKLLKDASDNDAKIFGGFDRKKGLYIFAIEGYNKFIYNDGFNGWILEETALPIDTPFQILTPPAHGDVVLVDNQVTYTPDTDYVGHDTFTYEAFIDGVWKPQNVCIDIKEDPVLLGWRQKESTYFCVLDGYGLKTGYKGWTTLEQYNQFTSDPVGNEKPNSVSDPDYVAPIYDPSTCALPDPVVVNYDVQFGVDPFTWNGLIFMRNGVEVLRIQSVTSGTISGIFYTGDTIKIRQISSPSSFPWAPSSKANLTIDIDASEVYNADISVQSTELQNYETVIPSGASTIDVNSVGSSTAVGYKTYALQTTNGLAQDRLRVNIDDDTTSAFVINVQPATGGPSTFNFNVLDNADDMTITIYNQSLYDVSCETVGALGFTDSSVILAGGNKVLTNVPKGGVEVTTTPVFACGSLTPYTGGEAFPTEILITLGASTGTVNFDFDAQSIPDKFIVEFDSVEVINTGYRGDTSQQAALDANLASRGLPPETITAPGNGSTSFVKSTATTTALVKVFGPLPGTAWSFTLHCPVP